ncbi:MAG: type II toxin-antitoxin system Phd/YefM family antitoxin [Chlamydiota bacterium]
MQSYTLTEVRNQHGKVFDRAKLEPVLITKQKRPSHVILSAEAYQKLIDHIQTLEGKTSPAEPYDTPDAEIIEGVVEGMRQALAGDVIPLEQMWEGIDVD